jgi:hypothetical protein
VKVNAMLLEIGRGLLRVPLENHAGSLQSGSASLGLPNTEISGEARPGRRFVRFISLLACALICACPLRPGGRAARRWEVGRVAVLE